MKENMLHVKIAYIGGGSRAWARTFMTDLALEPELGGEVSLYDIDYDAAKQNELIGNRLADVYDAPGKWRYTTAQSLQEALTGADFVIISILPGNLEHMRSDVHLPERLGVYQSVGDTTGPGGIIRALRTLPVFAGFAEAIRDCSPDAWVINYTNPMALCVRTLYHVFPQIKAFGCCHEVFGAQELLAAMAEREFAVDAQRSDIRVNVIGLNHFTWFDRASFKDADMMPVFARYAEEFFDSGFSTKYDSRHDKVFRCANRVKFDLFRKHALIAAAGDRHLAEFMPGDMYLKTPETAEHWGFTLTSVDWRVADRLEKVERAKRLASGTEELELKPSGEEGVLLLKALCGLGDVTSNVNMPNRAGQIGNLPESTVVETNARFSRDKAAALSAGALPSKVLDLLDCHIKNQDDVLQAALNTDRELVLKAFSRDPLLSGRCAPQEQRALADDMIRNTLDVLPRSWRS